MELQIQKFYQDKMLGRLMYLGKQGYDVNLPNTRKGFHIFVCFSHQTLVQMSKKEIELLTKC